MSITGLILADTMGEAMSFIQGEVLVSHGKVILGKQTKCSFIVKNSSDSMFWILLCNSLLGDNVFIEDCEWIVLICSY